ncbi:uncharacterized protein LOC121234672 [Juglans microcarpa x Juglans regia]|uniref:uncharacterized protein LOC121234672 n=1 Tax=Juglans microcarpa x Juglans regia TaxID=2249226 RepID=UPI001B7DA381|nr:uncharacterized protein LOC121234672 [Juglans microcarpa x Juglans regia]
MVASVAKGASLNHISRESSDIRRLTNYYNEVFGFEEIESLDFVEFKVIWFNLAFVQIHLIERNPSSRLLEGPWSATSPVTNPNHLPRGHHICFSVSNFEYVVRTLKEKEIKIFERSLPDGKVKQVFFFDLDGNELEIGSLAPDQK